MFSVTMRPPAYSASESKSVMRSASLNAQCQTLTVDGDAYNGFVLVGPMARHKHY